MGVKAREVLIRVESLEDAGERFAGAYKQIKQGKKLAKEEVLAFENIETLRKVLTSKRIVLLRLVREKQPKTIYQLAKLSNRAYANVFQDVKLLEKLGLIVLQEDNHNFEPIAKYNAIKIKISV